MQNKRKIPSMNNQFVRNTIRSFGDIAKNTAKSVAPNTSSGIKKITNGFSKANIPNPNIDRSKTGMSKKIMDSIKDEFDKLGEDVDRDYSNVYKEDAKGNKYNFNSDMNSEGSRKNVFQNNLVKNTVIVSDVNTRSTIKLVERSFASITRSTVNGLNGMSNSLMVLNRFNDEIDINFFNDSVNYMNEINNTVQRINDNLSAYSTNRLTEFSSNIEANNLNSLLRVERMFSLQDINDNINKVIGKNSIIDRDMIKAMVNSAITNPIGSLIGFGIRGIMGKDLTDAIKRLDDIPTSINNKLLFGFKNMQNSDNPILSMLGEKFGPEKTSKAIKTDHYEKGRVAFDSETRKAIVNVIPTLISNIISAADPETYPDPLVYDYHKGRFTTKSISKKYMEREYGVLSKDVKSLNDAKKVYEKMEQRHKEIDRFSNDNNILNMEDEKPIDYGKMAKDIANNKLNKKKSKARFSKLTNGINKLADKIDNLIFGSDDVDVIADKGISKALSLGEKYSDTPKNIFSHIKTSIIEPLKNTLKDLIKQGKSYVSEFLVAPLKESFNQIIKPLKEKFKKENKGKGFFSKIIDKTSSTIKDKVLKPINDKLGGFKDFIVRGITMTFSKLTSFLNNKASEMKAKRESSNVSNAMVGVGLGFATFSNNESKTEVKQKPPVDNTKDIIMKNPVEESYDRLINHFNLSGRHVDYIGKYLNVSVSNLDKFYTMMKNNIKNIKTFDKLFAGYISSLGIEPETVTASDKVSSSKISKIIKKAKSLLFESYDFTMSFIKDIDVIGKAKNTISRVMNFGSDLINKSIDMANFTAKIGGSVINKIGKRIGKVFEFSSGFISKISDKFVPLTKKITKDVIPKTIEKASEITGNLIDVVGGISKKAAKSAIRLAGSVVMGGMKVISKLTSVTGRLFKKSDNKDKTKKKKFTIRGSVVGGSLDGILQSVEVIEVKKSNNPFAREDVDDANDIVKVNKNADAARGLINDRITARNQRMSKMMSKIVSTGLNVMGTGLSFAGSFLMGGTVGNILASGAERFRGTKLGKFLGKLGVGDATPVYVVGGHLDGDGGGILDSIDGKSNNTKTSGKGKSAGKLSKIKNLVKSKKGKAGLIAAGVAALAGGGAYLYNKNKDKEEEKIVEPQSRVKSMQSPQQPRISSSDSKKVVNEAIKTAGSTLSLQMYNRNPDAGGAPNSQADVARKEKSNIDKIQRVYDTESKKQLEINSVAKTKRDIKESKVEKSTNDVTMQTKSLIGTTSTFEDMPDVTPDELVKRYRAYNKTDLVNEKELFTKLNKNEKIVYSAQKGMSAVTKNFYDPKNIKNVEQGKLSFGKMLGNFLTGFSIGGLFGGALSAIGGFGKSIVNAIFHPIKTVKKVGSWIGNTMSKIGGWFKNLFGGGSSNNGGGGSSGTGTSAEGGPDMSWAGTGDMPLGQKMVMYGSLFLPTGKLRYSQPQREGINNQGNTADCSSYVRHIYKVTTGKDPGGNSSAQKNAGRSVPASELAPGDILWRSGHVAMYAGGGKYLNVGGNPDPDWRNFNAKDWSSFRRVIDPNQKVGPGLNNPNRKVTGLSGNELTANSSSTAAANQGSNVKDNNANDNTGRSITRKTTKGDPPECETASCSIANIPKPPTPTISESSVSEGIALSKPKINEADIDALYAMKMTDATVNSEIQKEVKSPVAVGRSNVTDINDVRATRAMNAGRNRRNLYSGNDNAETILYEAIVMLLKKLKENSSKLKDKENILVVNYVENVLADMDNGVDMDIDSIRMINNSIKHLAEGR